MVQDEANKRNGIFFCDCGLGNVFENDDIECEDLCGWLLPKQLTSDFEPLFKQNSEKQHEFDAYYCSVDFSVDEKSGKVQIDIDDTPDDLIVDDFNMIKNNVIIKK